MATTTKQAVPLDLAAWARKVGMDIQGAVNETAPLRELAAAAPLVPYHSDLSCHATGERPSYFTRILHQLIAMAECGATESRLRAVANRLHEFIDVVVFSSEKRSLWEIIREAQEADADEEKVETAYLSGRASRMEFVAALREQRDTTDALIRALMREEAADG